MSALNPTSADALASASRLLQYALDGSATTDEAFQKLYAAVDPRQRANLRQLESLLRSPESDATMSKSLLRSAYPTLAWLLRQTASPERSAAPLLSEFRRHQSFSAASVVVVWNEFAGFLTYLGAVLGVLIVVAVIYGLLVLPQFKSLYGGVELPALTSAVFGHGVPLFVLGLSIPAALLAALSWFVLHLRRQLRRYLPMPSGYQKVPLVGLVVSAYNQYLWLSYAALLRATRMPVDQALKVAATRLPGLHAGQWNSRIGELPNLGESPNHDQLAESGLIGELSIAARLGKLDEEVQFQQDATVDLFLTALARCRRRSRIVLTILVYFLVATFVSGMYLPIFSLGSAI
jgi:type II secretory pathway component PulF